MSEPPPKVLVIAVPDIGDALLCTPLISAVRVAWPDAVVHVLVRGAAGGVLEGNSDVDEIIEVSQPVSARASFAMLRARFRAYDLVLSNSASDRMAFYSLCLARRRISIVPARGNNATLKRWLYHKHVEFDEDNWHAMTGINRLGELAGIRPGRRIVVPRSPNSREAIARHLGRDWQKQRIAVVHPTGTLPCKLWTAAGWRDVIDYVAGRGLRVVATGGPGESERRYVFDELGLAEQTVTDLVGKLRLGDVAELLAHSVIYFGVDTVVSHIAASAGTPAVVIFGPISPAKWGPWPYGSEAALTPWRKEGSQRIGNVYIVRATDRAGDSLSELSPSQVIAAIEAMLADKEVEARR